MKIFVIIIAILFFFGNGYTKFYLGRKIMSKKIILSVISVFMFFSVMFLSSEQISKDKKISVEKIVNKYLNAIGGEKNLKKVNSKILRYKVFMQTMGGFVMEKNIKKNEWVKSGRAESDRYTLFDGKKLWRYNGDKKKEMKGGVVDEFRKMTDIDGPFVDYKKKGISIKYIGKEKVEFSEFLKLEVIWKDKSKNIFYFDKNTGLLKMQKEPAFKMVNGKLQQGQDTITYYYDYREVEGIKYPFYWIQTNAKLEHMHMFKVEKLSIK